MSLLDFSVLGFYLLGTIAVGVYYAGRNKTSRDMFSAGGQSPWWVAGLSGFMTMKSAGTFVVWGGMAYRQGLVAIVITSCIGLSALLVGWLIAGEWRKIGVRTPAEFVERRFGAGAVQLYTWTMMAIRIVTTGVALYSVAIMLVALVPLPQGHLLCDPATGHLSMVFAILLFGVIVTFYTVIGGLWAVLMTDVVQFIILQLSVVFVIILLILRFYSGQPLQPVPADFFHPLTSDFSVIFLMGWVAVHFFIIGAEWAFAQRYISVPTVRDAKWSAWLFGALYIVSPSLWLAPPLLFRLINSRANPEQAYVLASQYVLPNGMLGLMIAAMFSATASAISGQINVFAGVLTEQFFHKRFRPDASEAQLVRAGRIFTLLLGLALICVALLIPWLGGAEKIILAVTGMLFAPLMAPLVWGLLGRKVDTPSLWLTVIISFAAGVCTKFLLTRTGPWGETSIGQWSQSYPHLTEVLVGAALPIALLSFLTLLKHREADGWARLQASAEPDPTSASALAHSDRSHSIVVAICLAVTGVLMVALSVFTLSQRTPLLLFGLALCSISVMAFLLSISWRPDKSLADRR